MNTKLQLTQELKTFQHTDFSQIRVSCSHDYFSNKNCPDLDLVLTQASKEQLQNLGFSFKEDGEKVIIGREGDRSRSELQGLPPIAFVLVVKNPRFYLVTDLTKNDSSYNPRTLLFFQKGGLNGEASEASKQIEQKYINQIKFPSDYQGKIWSLQRALANTESLIIKRIITQYIRSLEKTFESSTRFNTYKEWEKHKNKAKILGVFFLDTRDLLDPEISDFLIKFEAKKVKLRYKILHKERIHHNSFSRERLRLKHIFTSDHPIVEYSKDETRGIELEVNRNADGDYELISRDYWKMTERNPHTNPGFFKFEVRLSNRNIKGKGKAELFLPFPRKINAIQIKEDGSILHQDVKTLRFGN